MAGEVARITLPCDKFAPVGVRRRLAQLPDPGWLLGDAMLVATELVTNAIRYSMCNERDVLLVTVDEEPGQVRIAVRDPGRSGGTARISDENCWPGGLGLRIVEQLATHWGSHRVPDGYEVWAELAVASPQQTHPGAREGFGREATSPHSGR
jgi:anti-sigma regulatory factor (Ser/Thr protein kinase)